MTTQPQPPQQPHYPPQGWRAPPPPRTAPQPTRGPQWWRKSDQATRTVIIILAILAPLLLGGLIVVAVTQRAGSDDVTVDVTSCLFTGEPLPSVTAEFTATNTGSSDRRIVIEWEFRDSSGARIDTDTTRITVPAGDTIRDSETTLLPVAASGTCRWRLR